MKVCDDRKEGKVLCKGKGKEEAVEEEEEEEKEKMDERWRAKEKQTCGVEGQKVEKEVQKRG